MNMLTTQSKLPTVGSLQTSRQRAWKKDGKAWKRILDINSEMRLYLRHSDPYTERREIAARIWQGPISISIDLTPQEMRALAQALLNACLHEAKARKRASL